jgi:hypothetical protein
MLPQPFERKADFASLFKYFSYTIVMFPGFLHLKSRVTASCIGPRVIFVDEMR